MVEFNLKVSTMNGCADKIAPVTGPAIKGGILNKRLAKKNTEKNYLRFGIVVLVKLDYGIMYIFLL